MSVSMQTVVLMLLAGIAAQIAAFFLNNLDPIPNFPGKNGLFLRMTVLFTLVPLLVAVLTDADEKGVLTVVGQTRVWCWVAVGSVAIALLYDVTSLMWALRKAKLQDRDAIAGAAAVSYAPQLREKLLAEARRQVQARLKYAYGKQDLINLTMRPEQAAVMGSELDEEEIFLVPQPKQQVESWKDGRVFQYAESEKTILETFDSDEIAGQLLILGAPGSGKTTTLLTLAEELLVRAEGSVQIPYIFELSTWQAERQDIASWLIDQLKFEHGIDEAVSRQWILDRQLLPLLDGLDEVDRTLQKECVQKINEFVTGQLGQQVVVCCRARIYDRIVREDKEKLDAMNGALRLQPLELAQVQAYFEGMGRQDILTALQDEQGLGALLQPREDEDGALLSIPLFLQILAVAYQPGKEITTKPALLDAYVSKRLSVEQRKEDRQLAKKKRLKIRWAYESMAQEPDVEETKRYLRWLAKKLNANAIPNVFLIERMQPSWLETVSQKWQYRVAIACIYGFVGALFGYLSIGFPEGILCLLFLYTFGLLSALGEIEIISTFEFHLWRDILKNTWYCYALIGCLLLAQLIGLRNDMVIASTVGATFGTVLSLIMVLPASFRTTEVPNQNIVVAAKNIPLITALSYVAYVLISFHFSEYRDDSFSVNNLMWATPYALLFGFFSGGGVHVVGHYMLRLFLFRQGHIPLNYAKFLRYTTERRLTQQIGGSFRFIHRELLDHFADIYPESTTK
ncbi:MAG: NACHT domain-containing protein [Cyanobacteria bacterium J06581_3]